MTNQELVKEIATLAVQLNKVVLSSLRKAQEGGYEESQFVIVRANMKKEALDAILSTLRAEVEGVSEDKILRTEEDLNRVFTGEPTPPENLAFTPDKAVTGAAKLTDEVFKAKTNAGPSYKTTPTVEGEFTEAPSTEDRPVEETKSEKVESTMENVKAKTSEQVDRVKTFLFGTKEQLANKLHISLDNEVVDTAKEKTTSFFTKVGSFFKKHAKNILLTIGTVIVAGAVTTTATAAIAVGAGISLSILVAEALIQKKKGNAISKKELGIQLGLVAVTALVIPYSLYALAYAGIYTVAYGIVLPYSIIVA